MFTRNRVTHHESGTTTGIRRSFTASSLCFTSKEPRHRKKTSDGRGINISGVDFWHAVEFSRNGRFLCTHPRRLSSGRFPSVLRFRLYQTVSDPISSALSRFPLSRFPFRQSRLYQILSGLTPSQRGLPSRPLGRSDVSNLSGSARQFLIGLPNRRTQIELNSGTPKSIPLGDRADGLGCR